MTDAIETAAERLRQAHASGQPCAPVRDLIGPTDTDAAYAVQEANTKRWLAEGRRIVGRKIGLTSVAVQKQLGVDQPDFGILFEDMASGSGEEMPFAGLMQPKVEAEIAFVLEQPLTKRAALGRGYRRGDRLCGGGDRDRRQPHRQLGHQARRHHCRQCLEQPVRARHQARQARRISISRLRHGDGEGRGASLHRRRRRLPRQPAQCRGLARRRDGRSTAGRCRPATWC